MVKTETVHVIPVGFDYERLLHPISKGDLPADRVRLIDSDRSDATPATRRLAQKMLDKLEYAFSTHLDVAVEIDDIDYLYNYKIVYQKAYDIITAELDRHNTVWINISSMPRVVAFAFATAANAYIVENPEERSDIHTYYVKPEEYYATEMLGELQAQQECLQRWAEEYDDPEIEDRLHAVDEILSNIERSGITKGADRMDDGNLHVEFPAAPLSKTREFEIELLRFLAQNQPLPSTSALARELGAEQGIEPDADEYESLRSKVQYNVEKLEEKGYIKRTKKNNSFETRLSVMGELWVETNTDISVSV